MYAQLSPRDMAEVHEMPPQSDMCIKGVLVSTSSTPDEGMLSLCVISADFIPLL